MFSYPSSKLPNVTPTKAFFLALLIAIWIATGLTGHDPWKPDEAYSFGLVYHILQSGDWLVPTLVGEPFMDKPPIFYWTAAFFAKLFHGVLPDHDGARLASGFFTALTVFFTGLAGRELFGKSRGWGAAIILIGCLGMLVRAHELITDLALLAGCAIMLFGYALSLRRPQLAGVILGIGIGIGFMSKGFIAPILFLLISLSLLIFTTWRTRSFFTTLGIATACALPWLTIWPYLLYQHSPQLFIEWAWTRNIARWLNYAQGGDYNDGLYYLKNLPWLAWPAFPLAVWAVWEARKKVWRESEFQLLLVSFIVMLVTLSFVPNIQELYALPMLLPITLLATASLATLRRGAANALDWFGIMTFALLAIVLWAGWTGLLVDSPAKITELLKDYQPDYEAKFQETPFWIAVISSVLWIVMVWRVGRSIHRSVTNWASGVTLLWVLSMTLWLPWLESGKSYRGMVASMKKSMPKNYICVGGIHIGINEQAMLQYFGNITTKMKNKQDCNLLLVEEGHTVSTSIDATKWRKIWEGSRTGDMKEKFRLYHRQENNGK
jgi:4-amino-4-deoxy-L-arabinose transferase-like glycosyltransferase